MGSIPLPQPGWGSCPTCFRESTAHLAPEDSGVTRRWVVEAGGGEEISDRHLGKTLTRYVRAITEATSLQACLPGPSASVGGSGLSLGGGEGEGMSGLWASG